MKFGNTFVRQVLADIIDISRLRPVPIQITLHPDIDVTRDEDREKHHHLNESKRAEVPIHQCPRKEKDHFDIEDQKLSR